MVPDRFKPEMMKHARQIGLSAVIVITLVGITLALTRCQSVSVVSGSRLATYATEPFGTVLGSHVREGLVDYAGLRRDHEIELNQFLDAMARFGPRSSPSLFPSRESRLAYYLNAYNAIMLRKWLDAGAGLDDFKPRDVGKSWFFFDLWLVDGTRISLNTLEQKINQAGRSSLH